MLRVIPNLEFIQKIEEFSETCRHDDAPSSSRTKVAAI